MGELVAGEFRRSVMTRVTPDRRSVVCRPLVSGRPIWGDSSVGNCGCRIVETRKLPNTFNRNYTSRTFAKYNI